MNLLRETVTRYGVETTTDEALLGFMLSPRGDPTARAAALLTKVGGLKELALLGPKDLEDQGLSALEAQRWEVHLELSRRASRAEKPPRITSPRAAGDYLLPRVQGWTEERFGLLALNAKGDLLAERILSHGTASATLISPREFFREALRYGASQALAFHNHPSGDPMPSREDTQLTHRLRAAGESLGVALADHIILGATSFHSYRAAEGWDRA